MADNSVHIHIVTLGEDKAGFPRKGQIPKGVGLIKKNVARAASASASRSNNTDLRNSISHRPFTATAARNSTGNRKFHTYPLILDSKFHDKAAIGNFDNSLKQSLPHAGFPIGAHNSGFYSKIRSSQHQRTLMDPINIPELIDEITLPERVYSVKSEEVTIVPLNTNENGLYRRPTLHSTQKLKLRKKIECFKPEPDTDIIENALAQLVDPDNIPSKIEEALSELCDLIEFITEPSMAFTLFHADILPIITALIPNFLGNIEIQVSCCILINYVLSNYEESYQTFLASNGMKQFLKANEVANRAYQSKKNFQQSKVSASLNFNTSAMSSTKSPSISARPSISYDHESLFSIVSPEKEDPEFRTCPIEHTSLEFGALSTYFDSRFLENLEVASPDLRKQAFLKLLTLYQRFDRSLGLMKKTLQSNNIQISIDTVISGGLSILGARDMMMYKYNETTKELIPIGSNSDTSITFSLDDGIIGSCLKKKELFVIKNPKALPEFIADIDFPCDGDLESMMAFPVLYSDNSPAGVIVAYNKETPFPYGESVPFDQEDEYIFKMIGACCGTIMSNAKFFESVNDNQKKVTVLLETTKSLASILDLDKLIKVIMDSAKELLTSDRCTLFLHDPERRQLVFIIQGRDSVQEIRIPSNAGIAGASFTSGEPINIQNAYQDSRFNPEIDRQSGYLTKTILCMPIKNIRGEPIGLIQLINKRIGVFIEEDEMILSSFCSQAAVAIEKSQLFKKTEDMRIYLQSILSSITSCVVTLSESLKLNTINRTWFEDALGFDIEFMKANSAEKWLGQNSELLKDIRQVSQNQESVFATDFEIKGKTSSLIVNYQLMPLIGGNGVVLVLDDISSEKRAVMTLGRYMSPALAKQVMEEGSGQLGGTRKKVSILFSDIRSFTTLSEGMDPPEVVDLLNNHFTDAVNAITEEQGILDKFIGDAVMAVFGVPFAYPEDAIKSCNAALRMRDSLVITNKNRLDQQKMAVKIGIGINTGMVLSGNIGSLKRMEFSCIGDAVNLASRVEGLTKFYGVQILITENTLNDCGDTFITREIDSVVVTGKKNAVRIFELLGRKEDKLDFDFLETIRMYAMALRAYRKRAFDIAADNFKAAIEITDDGPSKVLFERCKKYKADPPPAGWTGDYVAEGK